MKNPALNRIPTDLKKKLKDLHALVKKSNGIIIAGHINADGDDISSQLALGEYLRFLGKKYIIAWQEDVPRSFLFLPKIESISNILKNPVRPEDFDLAIVVDCGDLERIGEVRKLLYPGLKVVNIDHHRSNTQFGSLNIVEEKASSIGEILYYFFNLNRIPINRDMAAFLYVSIVSDTGSFRYDNTSQGVHYIAAELLEKGINPSDYNINLFQNKSLPYIKFLTLVMNRMELIQDDLIAISYLNYEDFQNQQNDETDGIIEYLGMLHNVSVYVLIKEKKPNFYTASLRSKNNVDVAKIAAGFNGGGHLRAAGCRTNQMDLNAFKQAIVDKIREQL